MDEQTIFLFADYFDRADSEVIGNAWNILDDDSGEGGDIDLANNALLFETTNDLNNRPVASHSFASVSDGRFLFRLGLNFVRSKTDADYALAIQIGDSSSMDVPATTGDIPNTGVGVNLLFAGPMLGLTHHEAIGTVSQGVVTEVGVASGPVDIEVMVDMDAGQYDILVGDTSFGPVSFDTAVSVLDTVRFLTSNMDETSFSASSIDYVFVDSRTLFDAAGTIGTEENSTCD